MPYTITKVGKDTMVRKGGCELSDVGGQIAHAIDVS